MKNNNILDVLTILNDFWLAYISLWKSDSDYYNHAEWLEHITVKLWDIKWESPVRLRYTDLWFQVDRIYINENILQEDKYNYYIIDRDDEISNLINWIHETKKESDKTLMIEDLQSLLDMTDDYILSSIDTNDYIDSTWEDYNKHCDALLKLTKELW